MRWTLVTSGTSWLSSLTRSDALLARVSHPKSRPLSATHLPVAGRRSLRPEGARTTLRAYQHSILTVFTASELHNEPKPFRTDSDLVQRKPSPATRYTHRRQDEDAPNGSRDTRRGPTHVYRASSLKNMPWMLQRPRCANLCLLAPRLVADYVSSFRCFTYFRLRASRYVVLDFHRYATCQLMIHVQFHCFELHCGNPLAPSQPDTSSRPALGIFDARV